jgi:hypothetical protein
MTGISLQFDVTADLSPDSGEVKVYGTGIPNEYEMALHLCFPHAGRLTFLAVVSLERVAQLGGNLYEHITELENSLVESLIHANLSDAQKIAQRWKETVIAYFSNL